MSRSLRQQMLTTPPPGLTDNNQTTFQSTVFTQVYIYNQLVGGMMDIAHTENNNTSLQGQMGNDRQEYRPGPRIVTWSMTRNVVRGRSIKDILAQVFPDIADVDFRFLQFPVTIHQFQQTLSGLGDPIEDTHEELVDALITSYSSNRSDAYGFRQETISGQARGTRVGGKGGVVSLNAHSSLYGNGTAAQLLKGHSTLRAS